MKPQTKYPHTGAMLQDFFSKPLTLIFAITFALVAASEIILPIFSGGSPTYDVFSVAFAVGFFTLYFKAKSQTIHADFKAPLTLIKVTAIIYTCTIGISLAAMILLIPMLSSIETMMPSVTSTLTLLLLAASAFMFVYFMFNLGFAIFASSMKKTYKTNEVKRTGSVLTSVSGFLYIAAFIGFVIVLILMMELIISAIVSLIMAILSDSSTSADFTFTSLSTANTLDGDIAYDLYSSDLLSPFTEESEANGSLLGYLSPAITFLNVIMTSIYTLCYNSFMKKAAMNFDSEDHSAPSHTPSSGYSGYSANSTYSGQSYSSPAHFNTPPRQNTYGGPAVPATMSYSRALAPEINFGDDKVLNDRRICPTCGSKVELSLDFCPQCGYKFFVKDEVTEPEIPTPAPTETVEPAVPVIPVVPTNTPVEPISPAQVPTPVEPVPPSKKTNPFEPVVPVQKPDPFAPVAPVQNPDPFEPVAPVQNPDPFAPVAPVQNPDPFEPVAPVQNPDPFEPVAPVQNPDPFAPVAPVQNPDPFAPVAPVQNPDPFAPVAPVQNPDPFAPVAPVQKPDPFAPVAPVQNPDPFAPVAPVQNPDPFAPVVPTKKKTTIQPDPQAFVAPFETVDTIPDQPSFGQQPFVPPFPTINAIPMNKKAPTKEVDDDPKPYISNSNLRR